MFLNAAPRFPFDDLSHGPKAHYRYRPEKDLKRHSRPKPYNIKDSPKKPEDLLKDFIKALKLPPNSDLSSSLHYTLTNFSTVPKDLTWQIFLELTDIAKRENKLSIARALLEISSKLQPTAHQTWLESSKLEEESGNFSSALRLLFIGLQFSPYCEQIFIKLLKIEEKIGDVSLSRRVLASLHSGSIEKNWKILLEGGLMEARNGNFSLARHIIHSLLFHCSTFGALYLEAVKFEEKWGKNLGLALEVCEKGLNRIPRYGPLWFAALRISEKMLTPSRDVEKMRKNDEFLQKQNEFVKNAEVYLSKELLWRFFLDFSIFLDCRNQEEQARGYLKLALQTAPENLRWKVWIFAARLETKARNFERAFKILKICESDVPTKQKHLVLIEISQLQEITGNPEAKQMMNEAWDKSGKDWKVCLDKIFMEMRNGFWNTAKQVALEAITLNTSTGRLWASLIQILHAQNSPSSIRAFILAIQEVPKSGEVWCEGARLRLNPSNPFFNLNKAEEYLSYAIQFTPQYADSFIEMIRVLIVKGELWRLKELKRLCLNADPNYGLLWFFCKKHPVDGPREVWRRAKKKVLNEVCRSKGKYFGGGEGGGMWMAIGEVVKWFERYEILDLNCKMRFICGSEGVVY